MQVEFIIAIQMENLYTTYYHMSDTAGNCV